jgi:hypothetical protein
LREVGQGVHTRVCVVSIAVIEAVAGHQIGLRQSEAANPCSMEMLSKYGDWAGKAAAAQFRYSLSEREKSTIMLTSGIFFVYWDCYLSLVDMTNLPY